MQRKLVSMLLLVVLGGTLACATVSKSEKATPTPTTADVGAVTEIPPTPEALSTETPPETLPTETPPPTPGCTFGVAYVADVTVPDDTVFAPNTAFVKTWRIQNSGTCDWESGSLFVYVSGDPLGGPANVPLPLAVAGTNVDVSVDFVAPSAPGTYRSNWQAQSPDGVRFGGQAYVQIVVPEPTPLPTETPLPTPTATETPAPADWPVLRRTNTGANVYALQYLLKSEGATITADGNFGPATETAVKDFQQAHGLAADGVVGPQTWSELIKNHTLRTGDKGDAVQAAQYLLVNVYNFTITIDGVFGSGTRGAVQTFQTAHNLASDGVVGQNTWKLLVVGP